MERYKTMQEDTLKMLADEIKNRRVILKGDFNCKEVNWGDFETEEGEYSWGSKLLKLPTDILMKQWVKGETMARGGLCGISA